MPILGVRSWSPQKQLDSEGIAILFHKKLDTAKIKVHNVQGIII